MTWILTCTGREHNLEEPQAAGYTLGEIAHALSHINRYTGHTYRAYSVAEHSLLVADMVHSMGLPATHELCALMHDAHEVLCGDIVSPLKALMGVEWHRVENNQQRAMLTALGLYEQMCHSAAIVNHYDLVALATERRDLLPFDPAKHKPWPVIDTPGQQIKPWKATCLMAPSLMLRTPHEWADLFAKRAMRLAKEVGIELPN